MELLSEARSQDTGMTGVAKLAVGAGAAFLLYRFLTGGGAASGPKVNTGTASEVDQVSAVLNGNVSSLGGADQAAASFEWGPSALYGQETPAKILTSPMAFSAMITGLDPDTMYYFRAKMIIGDQVYYGIGTSFRTEALPAQGYSNLQGTYS